MTMQSSPFFQDLFQTLEDTDIGRRTQFEAFRPDFLRSPMQQQAFSQMLQPTFNRFLGLLGQQMQAGQPPGLTFADFLEQQDFGRQFRRASPQMTGQTRGQFVSPGRFFFDR